MSVIDLSVNTIGSIATQICSQDANGCVVGNTSKGIFLRVATDRILFCSREQFHGPLTINFDQPDKLPAEADLSVKVVSQQILLGEKYRIPINAAPIWRSPVLETRIEVHPCLGEAQKVGLAAHKGLKTDQPVAFLATLSEGLSAEHILDHRWSKIYKAISDHSPDDFFDALTGVIGYGRGLTPSGDDFILGVLLGIARYQAVLSKKLDIPQKYVDSLLDATKSTTSISRQLILAGMAGEADERLITAMDGWMLHTLDGAHLYEVLKTWGNSSGLDAFTGWVCFLLMQGML